MSEAFRFAHLNLSIAGADIKTPLGVNRWSMRYAPVVFGPLSDERLSLGPTFGLHSVHQFHSGPLAIHPRVFSRPPFSFTVTSCLRPAEKIHRRMLDSALVSRRGGATGLEPAASCVTGRRSNQLNYAPVENQFLAITTCSAGCPSIPKTS